VVVVVMMVVRSGKGVESPSMGVLVEVVTNRNYIQEDIESMLRSASAYYH
jgi:hypothetical protein